MTSTPGARTTGGLSRTLGGASTAVAVAAVIVVLDQLGNGPLALPADRSWGGVQAWAAERGAPTVAVAMCRAVAMVVAFQLVAVSAIGVVGHLCRAPSLVRAAEALTLPFLRSTGARLAALVLVASSVLGPRSAPAPSAAQAPGEASDDGRADLNPAPASAATIRLVEPNAPATPSGADPAPPRPDPAVASGDAPTSSATITLVTDPSTLPTPAAAPDPRDDPAEQAHPGPWTVEPGDHLWSIAEATLHDAGLDTTESAVTDYWRRLLLANSDLADPDLVFAGQVIERPPLGQ